MGVSPQILEDAGFGLGGSLGGFGTIAIVHFVAAVAALALVDSIGRKKLIAFGAVGSLLSHILIGTLFHNGVMGWPIVLAINSFIAFFACSLGPVKFVIVSEIFPNRIREHAIALSTFCIWITSAAVNMVFPVMQANMPTATIFYLYAGAAVDRDQVLDARDQGTDDRGNRTFLVPALTVSSGSGATGF